MAPIPVPTLRELSLRRSAQFLLVACKKLDIQYGDFKKGAVVTAVQDLQNSLLKQLGCIISDLCEKAHDLLSNSNDARILFVLEMHKYVKSFHFQDEMVYGDIKTDIIFWGITLASLTNVTVIDIRELCCDNGIITAICNNCVHLEVFRYSSRFRTMSQSNIASVTYESVARLLELKKLRFIQDTSHFVDVPKKLLKDFFQELLPRLENFELKDFEGLVLNNLGELDHLQITHLMLYKQTRPNMLRILRLCPKLQHLHLKGDNLYRGTFDDLVDYTTGLTSFQVDNFLADFMAGLSHFLFSKGDILTNLTISTEAVLSVNEVIIIGECCPRLQSLALHLRIKRTTNPYSVREEETPMTIYSHLNSLTLRSGLDCLVDNRIVNLFLKHDSIIEFLSLEGRWIRLFEEARTHSSRSTEIFPNLTTLDVWVGRFEPVYSAAVPLTKSLYVNCKKLKFFHLHSHVSFDDLRHFFALDKRFYLNPSAYTGEELVGKTVRYMNSTIYSDQ